MPHKTDIKSLNYNELVQYVESINEKKFRAAQLYSWMHEKLAESYDEMTNISDKLKDTLKEDTLYTSLKIVKMQESRIDGTRKYLFELYDGNLIESVFMKYHHGNSVCISSQVGCKMGCRFCASTLNGCVRNLSPSEMLDQIYRISRDTNERVSNVVIMGSGEPMDNYDNVIKFLELLSSPKGRNMSLRHVSLSTCGVVPKIRELAKLRTGLTLSVSLHAADDKSRSEIMPVNNAWQISELLGACRDYIRDTGRRISFEYAVISGVNDSAEDARRLAALLRGINCHINLIPVNKIKERSYTADRQCVAVFAKRLTDLGMNVTVRRTLGADINAACGPLRREYEI